MSKNKLNFDRDTIWRGCMLASISHAIMVAHYPELANEHSWDSFNYNIQNSSGSRGTITFYKNFCIGAFYYLQSDRKKQIEATIYFNSSPKEVVDIAKTETLQYLLQIVSGKQKAVITTSFWNENDVIFSCDSNDLFYIHGGCLITNLVESLENGLKYWCNYYDMTETQSNLTKKIYQMKIKNPIDKIILTQEEFIMIGTDNIENLNESKISFNEINIELNI